MSTSISRASFLTRARAFLMGALGSAVAADAASAQTAKPAAGAQKKAYQMVVLSNPVAGKEDEYNKWYTERHLYDVIALPGFVSAQRFKRAINPAAPPAGSPPAPQWQYAAVYNMETDDPQATMGELSKVANTDKMRISEALDARGTYSAIYEAITPVVAKKA